MTTDHSVGFDPADRLAQDPEQVRRRFWRKIRSVAVRLPFVEDILAAYYCAFDRQTPRHVQIALLGAIAYFILPFDFMPDILPVLGFTDDAAIAEWAGLTVSTFEGDANNMKMTTPEDFAREESRLMATLGDIRTGSGYDVHAFGEGDHVWLCGLKVPHSRGFLAHSDGDVGLHALVDAILGALADGDIGSHFPPTDPQWKGAASDKFLKYAIGRVTARGGRIANLEVTMICERPKIGPLRDAMRQRIAEITGVPVSRVAVKATTSEKLGFTGREEGIAATASATIRLPWGADGLAG